MAGRKKATTEEIKKSYGLDESEQAFKSIIGVKDEGEETQEQAKEPTKKKTAVKEKQEAQPTEEIKSPHGEEVQASDPIIVVAEKKEARSKRVNLLITPSVYASAKKKCKRLNISMNECVNQFLEKWGKETE